MEPESTNLTPRRGPSVWEQQRGREMPDLISSQRYATGIVGGALALWGMRQRSAFGALAAAAGAGLAYRAMMGCHDILALASSIDHAFEGCGWRQRDVVGEASGDSFPASDAPSWTPTGGTKTPATALG